MFRNNVSYYFSKSNALNMSILLLFFLITEVIINPIGNFPLNDDWVYGKAVLNLYNNLLEEIPTNITSNQRITICK